MNAEQKLNLIETDDENISQIVDDADNGLFIGVVIDTRHLNDNWTFSIYNNDFSADDVYFLHKSKAEDKYSALKCWEDGHAIKAMPSEVIDLTKV